MNRQLAESYQPKSAPLLARGLLQRKCACGQHAGGGECDACRKKVKGLQGQTADGVKEVGVPSIGRAARFAHDFSRVRTSAEKQAAKVPQTPVNEFEDCATDWQPEAEAALVIGRRWVNNVVVGLSSLPNPIPSPVASLLNRHFHTTDRKKIGEVLKHFVTINGALNSPIEFECETSCDPGVAAYVYSIWTDLHLCPLWHSLGVAMQANMIIHELAHDAANRDDEAYIWQEKYSKLSADDAIDNADSYSNFAAEAS